MATRILFVGLGNYNLPNTRHNAGMMILDHLANALELRWIPHKPWKATIAQTTLSLPFEPKHPDQQKQVELTLLKPRLLMNVSGPSVARAVRDLSIPGSSVYIFQDDLQRELGKVSLKASGSANGHNGIKSVIDHLRSDEFWRVRLGVGRPESRDVNDVSDYVLSKFTPPEVALLEQKVYPLLGVGPGLGLETLVIKQQLWRPPQPPKKKKKKQKSQEESPSESEVDLGKKEGTSPSSAEDEKAATTA
ncbi:peptidyl-tRNA hydrolase [Lichtheimia ornata]|uniref:peptidyl-tRNA hydrolase n=1 Tax=Lichtheimia ornata TaxID=688661 RepID=A0AAD7VBC1_9FUNG|nr:peptidyl-tRNA hydrolase [Lichtheimia ornata]KAJ8662038.1 peptidyl-tRNA hydrolase [Lichtheimia ornata]